MFSFQGKKKKITFPLVQRHLSLPASLGLTAQTHEDSNHFHAKWRFLPWCNDFMSGTGSAHKPVINTDCVHMQTNMPSLFRI